MTDFSRNTDSRSGAFSMDKACLSFPTGAGCPSEQAGLLLQNVFSTYNQQVTRLFELGSPNCYLVGGSTAGITSVGRLIGPRGIAQQFHSTYAATRASRHKAAWLASPAQHGRDSVGFARAKYKLEMVAITNVGISIAADDLIVNEQLQMMFSDLGAA